MDPHEDFTTRHESKRDLPSWIRELEIRIVGVDGNNGLQGRVTDLEKCMTDKIDGITAKLENIADDRNKRMASMEKRLYFIFGVPTVVVATIAVLQFFGLIRPLAATITQ